MKLNFLHLLTLIFTITKVTGYIDWSWWLVLLPSIISVTIGLTLVGFVLFIAAKE